MTRKIFARKCPRAMTPMSRKSRMIRATKHQQTPARDDPRTNASTHRSSFKDSPQRHVSVTQHFADHPSPSSRKVSRGFISDSLVIPAVPAIPHEPTNQQNQKVAEIRIASRMFLNTPKPIVIAHEPTNQRTRETQKHRNTETQTSRNTQPAQSTNHRYLRGPYFFVYLDCSPRIIVSRAIFAELCSYFFHDSPSHKISQPKKFPEEIRGRPGWPGKIFARQIVLVRARNPRCPG